eukprot:RCo050134
MKGQPKFRQKKGVVKKTRTVRGKKTHTKKKKGFAKRGGREKHLTPKERLAKENELIDKIAEKNAARQQKLYRRQLEAYTATMERPTEPREDKSSYDQLCSFLESSNPEVTDVEDVSTDEEVEERNSEGPKEAAKDRAPEQSEENVDEDEEEEEDGKDDESDGCENGDIVLSEEEAADELDTKAEHQEAAEEEGNDSYNIDEEGDEDDNEDESKPKKAEGEAEQAPQIYDDFIQLSEKQLLAVARRSHGDPWFLRYFGNTDHSVSRYEELVAQQSFEVQALPEALSSMQFDSGSGTSDALPICCSSTVSLSEVFQAVLDESLFMRTHKIVPFLCKKWLAYKGSSNLFQSFSPTQRLLLGLLKSYRDLFSSCRTWANELEYIEVVSLHVLNHVFKTKEMILLHNKMLDIGKLRLAALKLHQSASRARKSQKAPTPGSASGQAPLPLGAQNLYTKYRKLSPLQGQSFRRDRGFCNGKVLLLLPYRNIAFKYVNVMMTILNLPDEAVVHRDKFWLAFQEVVQFDRNFARRPEDFQKQFEGNINDAFCAGLRFQRKGAKLFSTLLRADVIIASPLQLTLDIEKELNSYHDFLSSVEVLIIDQADTIMMQNWFHLQKVLEVMNRTPLTVLPTTNFSRLHAWHVEKCSEFFRQSVLISRRDDPLFRALFERSFKNFEGKSQFHFSSFPGVLSRIYNGTQSIFQRLNCDSAASASDARLEYFTTQMWPQLKSQIYSALALRACMIVVPSYFDYVRVRNFLDNTDRQTFRELCEYTPAKECIFAQKDFGRGLFPLLLMTERYWFFKRYPIRSAARAIFYSPPFSELCFQSITNELCSKTELTTCIVLFTRFDAHALARIVGTERARKLLTTPNDTHMFA